MNLFFDETKINTTNDALSKYAADEFASPTRSTVPLLSWLKHEPLMVSALLHYMAMPDNCEFHLEYQVKPPEGKGQASHTDLMVIDDKSALAVEAKWTEPRYEPVEEWLSAGSNRSNRESVFNGWLSLIQKHASKTLDIGAFKDAVYQMVHRAASACATGSKPGLAYLAFKYSPPAPKAATSQQIHDDLKHLKDLLGNPAGFPFYLIEVYITPTDAFKAIELLSKGQDTTVLKVQDALSGDKPLFSFDKFCVTKI